MIGYGARARGIALAVFLAAMLASPAGAATLHRGFAMCRTQAALHRLIQASVSDDSATVRTLMKRSCAVISRNTKVKVLARTATLAQVAIIKRGKWWTVVEAVR